MFIELKKFGTTLTSRQMGREALSAFNPILNTLKPDEEIIVDFDGVNTFSPSWGDEFLTQLHRRFADRLFLRETKNPSVVATMQILEETGDVKFRIRK